MAGTAAGCVQIRELGPAGDHGQLFGLTRAFGLVTPAERECWLAQARHGPCGDVLIDAAFAAQPFCLDTF